ncbi:hypothetical protein ACQKRQ_36965 [Paraburkholderia sp. NPDC080076]|jgi:hypothetical protein|uniref:hypothetical protein n=1 Tax=Paraburkholderia sp. NPDC080076 TaxID=3390605 RepID=UPI003D08FC00
MKWVAAIVAVLAVSKAALLEQQATSKLRTQTGRKQKQAANKNGALKRAPFSQAFPAERVQ